MIAAIASPAGPGARIVLRVAGAGCHAMLRRMVEAAAWPASGVLRGRVVVEEMAVPAQVLLFAEGRSYTGEESAELHLPGNVLLAKMVLTRLYELGARAAEPGEFTARAFFNGRLDLTEAEGVSATISATNERELSAARRLQAGELTRRLRPITDELTQTLSLLEAGIDFAEEEIRFLSSADLLRRVKGSAEALRRLMAESTRFERLSHEPQVVLCGRPNAGKSTLLNCLAGRERAVVSPVAGTTRDLLTAEVMLSSGVVRMIDTAGLEEREATGEGALREIQEQMRRRAMAAIEQADVVVLVHAADDRQSPPTLSRAAQLVVVTKRDLLGTADDRKVAVLGVPEVSVSSQTGQGMEALREELNRLAFGGGGGEAMALNTRHLRQIELVCAELDRLADEASGKAEELAAEHLRYALDALGEITGVVSPDEVLGRIFSSFCIGK